jgi:hypothetical protein
MVDKSKSLAGFLVGNFSITTVLVIVFGIIGLIVGGWVGLGVGIVMPLATGLIALLGLIPFVGAFMFYPNTFNWFMDWLYNAVPSMHSFLGQGEAPRVILFWIGAIVATIATVIISIIVIMLIVIVIGALLS